MIFEDESLISKIINNEGIFQFLLFIEKFESLCVQINYLKTWIWLIMNLYFLFLFLVQFWNEIRYFYIHQRP
jgi:hypothetical protein